MTVGVSEREATQLVEVGGPEEERELERSSHVGSRVEARLSRYTPGSVRSKVHWRDEGDARCQGVSMAAGHDYIMIFGSLRMEEGPGRETHSCSARSITRSFTKGISFCGRGMPRGIRFRNKSGADVVALPPTY